jgi:hypothetical protein
MGAYQFREHKSKDDNKAIEELIVVEYDAGKLADIEAGARAGRIACSCSSWGGCATTRASTC